MSSSALINTDYRQAIKGGNMYTIGYSGFYIHGYFDKPACHVFGIINGLRYAKDCKSERAAKCYITRLIREVTACIYK
jgi:hypothetical protein